MKNKLQIPKILCVCSSGGHLTEMVLLMDALDIKNESIYVTYEGNAETFTKKSYFIKNVGKIKPMPIVALHIAKVIIVGVTKLARIIIKEKPDIIISTGSEIGMFAIILGKILLRTKVIYIECSAQVNKSSWSGKIVYFFADRFFVQWKPLLKSYGKKAKFRGNLIFGDV